MLLCVGKVFFSALGTLLCGCYDDCSLVNVERALFWFFTVPPGMFLHILSSTRQKQVWLLRKVSNQSLILTVKVLLKSITPRMSISNSHAWLIKVKSFPRWSKYNLMNDKTSTIKTGTRIKKVNRVRVDFKLHAHKRPDRLIQTNLCAS